MKTNERMRKVLSVLLTLCMMLSYVPVTAFAVTTDGLCEHHAEHTAECGYAEGEADCTYHCEICHVQALVDALPESVTAENAEAVAAQLAAIDTEKAALSAEETAQVDFAKYTAAVEALGSVYDAAPADTTYTVTLKGNGGELFNGDTYDDQEMVTVPYSDALALADYAAKFRREHYTLIGWNTAADGAGTGYEANASVTVTGDITLYAQWTEEIHTVTFDANGGTFTDGTTQKTVEIGYGKQLALSTYSDVVSKDGYYIDGWYKDDTWYAPGESIGITGNITLIASWAEIKYAIYLDPNGGKINVHGTESSNPFATSLTPGADIRDFVNRWSGEFSREGYTFKGFTTVKDDAATRIDTSAAYPMPEKTLTLYALWEATQYTVLFTPGEGAEGTAYTKNFTVEAPISITSLAEGSAGFSKVGHYQNNWLDTNGNTVNFWTTVDALIALADENRTVTLTARWLPISYGVYVYAHDDTDGTYDFRDGLSNYYGSSLDLFIYDLEDYYYRQQYGSAQPFTKANHAWTGWKWTTDEAGTTEYTGTTMPAHNLYLHGQWTELSHTFTEAADGRTASCACGAAAAFSVTTDGNTAYYTEATGDALETALQSNTSNPTVKLYRDLSDDYQLSLNQGCTLDLNGYTINVGSDLFLYMDTFTIKNGTIRSSTSNSVLNVSSGVQVTIEDITIAGESAAYGATVFGYSESSTITIGRNCVIGGKTASIQSRYFGYVKMTAPPDEGTVYSVYMVSPGYFTSPCDNMGGYQQYFTSAVPGYVVTVSGRALALTPCDHSSNTYTYRNNGDGTHTKVCAVCGGGETEIADHRMIYAPDEDAGTITYKCGDCGVADVTFTLVIPTGAVYGSASMEVPHFTCSREDYNGVRPTLTVDGKENHYPTAVGTYDVAMTWGGETVRGKYTIGKAALTAAQVTAEGTFTYNGKAHTPEPTVKIMLNGMETALTKDTDYTVSYSGNTNAGTATVTVTGSGNYTGTATATFPISKAKITVTANDVIVPLGTDMAAVQFTYTVSGLYGTDTLTKEPEFTLSAVPDTGKEGEYTITPGNADGGSNYELEYKTGLLKVKSQWTVTVASAANGKVSVSHNSAIGGTQVTITVTPDEGQEIGKVSVTGKDGNPVDVTDNGNGTYTYQQPNGDVTIEVTFKNVNEIITDNGGKVEIDVETPATGEDVTITVTPDEGKEIGKVSVTDKDGNPVDVTNNGDGTYTYRQPDGNVTIEVTFKTVYKIVKGNGGKWTKGSTSALSFTANGPLDKFTGILVNGKTVDEKNYTAKADQTTITLKASYLETLKTGDHTITVLYTDGETGGTFTVQPKSTSPATGDDSNIMLLSGMLCVSTLGLAVLLADRKRRRSTK